MSAAKPRSTPVVSRSDDSARQQRRMDDLVPLVYAELRRIAHHRLRGERDGHTLDTTALVHEAYLKLSRLDRIDWQGRTHFLAVAAQAIRRVLIDHAVARNAQKRGGGRARVPLDSISLGSDQHVEELVALSDALDRLKAIDERQARVVECRFFAGMTIRETAEAIEVSPATVKRDWRLASAWLYRELADDAVGRPHDG
ncbi:MAG: ECF-type sigma factor [Gemmatimonadota bacterium]